MGTPRSSRQSLVMSARANLAAALSRWLGNGLLLAITSVAAIGVLFILFFIARDAVPFFQLRGFKEFFTSTHWYPSQEPVEFGALSIFVGSGLVTLGAALVAAPLGVAAALCLSDVLPFGVRQAVKPVIEMLAAIPSVAYGFFALVVFAPWLQRLGAITGTNALNVSIILGIMALPTVVSVSEDALQAVGRELREGSYALGATRAETLLRTIVPAASSGILAAVLLGIMRALGETMVVWMASGNAAQIPDPWFNFLEPVRTLTATIAGDMGEADHVTGSARYHVLFAMGLCLLLFCFACNLISEWVVSIQRRKLKGE
ncbi:MAG: phosphate ABC transporter permease subunit PstC [Phycisphaerae bacterium]|nr:phosphate ABC transporter permease subunit PstC [Phycisphaerae bacterium]